jgi:malonate transporter and related proteins
MIFVLTVIAPVFGIIVLGFLSGRTGYLSEQAGQGIADFAFNISIPALLFQTILLAHFESVAPLGILASFFGAAAIVWALSAVVTQVVLRRPAHDAPAIAVCSVFGNTIMLGLPIGVATFGPDALAPISVILGIHAPVFLVAATLHSAAVADKNGATLATQLLSVSRQLTRQPLIVAIGCATIWRISGVAAPEPILAMVELLSKAGVPAALIALGLSLKNFEVRGDIATLTVMLLLKLMMMPLIAAGLATQVFHLPFVSAACVVLMAALPAGANAYLFAAKAGRATNSASAAVAIGTALSSLTLAAVIILYHG